MRLFQKLSKTGIYMLLSLAALFVFFSLLGTAVIVFVYPLEPLAKYLLGLLLGCCTTALRLIIMDRSIDKMVDMEQKKAQLHYQLMFFLRYGLLIAFAVLLVVLSDVFGVYGGVVGILCMQLSAYGANFLLTRSEQKAKAKKQLEEHDGSSSTEQ